MSFEKHSIQTILVRICLILFALIAGIIYSRWLGPEGFGILALLLLVKAFAFRLGNLGFGSAFAFFVAKGKISAGRLLHMVWFAGGVMSVLSGTVLLAVWRYSFSPWHDIKPYLFYICLPTVPLVFFNNYLQRILSGELRITAMNIANIFAKLSNVVFLMILVIIFKMGVAGAIYSLVLSDLLTFFYLMLQFRKRSDETVESIEPNSKGALIYSLWQYGRWSYLLMFSNFFVEELPLMILKFFSADNILVGLFSRAREMGRQSRIVILPVSQVLFPYTAASEETKATWRTNMLCRSSLVFMIFSVGLLALFIKPLILVLYGEAFLPSAKIFYVLAPGFCFWPLGHFLGIHVAASGRPREVFFSSFVTLIAAVIVCWVLIPVYGAVGAGLSASVIYIIHTFVRLLVYVKINKTSFSSVLFARRADWTYYQRILERTFSRFINKQK